MTYKANLKLASELKQELDSFRPITPEMEKRIMQKFRLDWNYHSSHIEGNQLTYGETKALLLFGHTAQAKPLKDHIEITGHNEAIKYIEEVIRQKRPLTENFIRELHEMILKQPYEVNAITPDGKPTKRIISIGKYKTVPNHVKTSTGEIFYFASPEETPSKMHDLLSWYTKTLNSTKQIPVLFACEFHYKFIRIHPFDDGNGRLARLLMNFILMQKGYPPAIIKTENKNEYFNALQQADAGNIEFFFNYICLQVIHSLELMIKGAKGFDIEEDDDLDKKIELFKRETKSKNKIILKNENAIKKTIEDVYIPFLIELDTSLKKFNDIFLSCEWKYCKGPSHPLNAIDSEQFESDALQNIIKQLKVFASNGAESKYEIRIFYNRFNDEDDSFDVAIAFNVFFTKRSFNISRFIGEPEETPQLARALHKLSETLENKGKLNLKMSERTIAEKKYNESVSSAEIKSWAKDSAAALFEYIKINSDLLDKRRNEK